jgi:hypothetical protein
MPVLHTEHRLTASIIIAQFTREYEREGLMDGVRQAQAANPCFFPKTVGLIYLFQAYIFIDDSCGRLLDF